MSKRPSISQTENDILKEQEIFLKNKEKPSVKLIKTNDIIPKITNAEIKIEEQKPVLLVGQIIERKTTNPVPIAVLKPSLGFPQAKRRQNTESSSRKSIFAQNKKAKNEEKSLIVTGNDSSDIHKENIETLNKMSEAEILEEQNKLLKSLDPKLVTFLKSKRNKVEKKMEIDEQTFVEPVLNIDKLESAKEILDNSENWLHFNQIEMEKLQWMRDIDIPKQNTNETYEARFDFNGILLPYSQEDINDSNRILYHHGEEPNRPGYTLKELFKLSRSNVHQQRLISLNTISQILYLNSTGIYDKIIEIPFEQTFFVIRFSVDDNSPNILCASLKCLQNLIFSHIDEACLDLIYGFGSEFEPILGIDAKIDKDTNDQQLSELDLIQCLVRTDIFTRFRYIINTIKPNMETINYCLNILIRISRDSSKIITEFYNFENLISSIINYFVPKIYKLENSTINCYNNPLPLAIKLLRILASRNKNIAQDLINRYNIFDSILSYVNTNLTYNHIGIKIQIETFKFIKILFQYNLKLEYFSAMESPLLSYLNYYLNNSNYDEKISLQSHYSGILNIISEVSKHNYNFISNFLPVLKQSFIKFCIQVSNSTKFECSKLIIISSLFGCLNTLNEIDNKIVLNLILSEGFKIITKNIKNGSNLICEFEPHKIGSNLLNLETAVWQNSEHIIQCLNRDSCLPFLTNLSNYIAKSSDKEVISTFLQHTNIQKYLNILNNTTKYKFINNWFTKFESNLILNILKCSFKIQNIQNSFLYYELAVKTLSIYSEEQKNDIDFILKNIIYNKNYFPSEILLNELKINENIEILNILPNLNEIYECYSDILGLKKKKLYDTSLEVKIGNIIPLDWVFMPIMKLYSQSEENMSKIDENQQIIVITRCLQWVFIYETYFPNLSSINMTDKFCRLSCIYLCSNTLFLEKNIQNLLELCFKIIITPENINEINFDGQIQGLNNFQDFYVQLLEQYQGVSYGDKLFANFILLPLIQKYNPKWKKIFWSEYLGVAQTIILDLNESLLDLNLFLEPPETDISILKCYRRALLNQQLNRSELLKYIADFHVENYIKTKKAVGNI